MNNAAKQQRFEDLVRGFLDGDSPDSVTPQQFEKELDRDASLLSDYLDQVELDALLAWELGSEDSLKNKLSSISGDPDPKQYKWPFILKFASAAMIAFAFGIGIGFFSAEKHLRSTSNQKVSNPTVAVLIDSEDCLWESSNDTPISFGTAFQKGETILIKSGIARLAMDGNAGIAVEGPAEVELVSSQEARVVYGRVSAYAPEEAIGFRLITPDVEIVDLGTHFAAKVDRSGRTEIHVFEGEVSVKGRKANQDALGEVIVEGQARLYSSGGTQRNEISIAPESFTDPPALEQLLGTTGPRRLRPLSFRAAAGNRSSRKISGVIVSQDFSGLKGIPGGIGFGEKPWMASASYTRIIPRVVSHSGKSTAGGYFLIRGRESSEVTVPNRLRRELSAPLPLDFYFSIRARYKGLDKDDFFALWIDSHDREDSTHGNVPNIGILAGEFYSRLHRDRRAQGNALPEDDMPFFLVGRYFMDPSNHHETVSFWLNPQAPESSDEAIPQPDSTRVETELRDESPAFQYIGLRMGKYTEVSDELLIDKILITSEWNALFD